mmetsp:Transcript_71522/g.207069  ORF Transcript_71522/g.207069 Transcript_71522/m.207069 type:complete len:256 (+) Transcript_71522:437-1204(+)
MSLEDTIPTMREISSDERKMRCNFEASNRRASPCNESPASTETTLNLWRSCRRNIWSTCVLNTFWRQATNSFTDRSKTSWWPSMMANFRSEAETTLLATRPPKAPESSFNVEGQTVDRMLSIVRSASTSGASFCTEASRIVPRRSKERADCDFNTAAVCWKRSARSRKSIQEKTCTTSPRSFKMGTRLGAKSSVLASFTPAAMMRKMCRRGVFMRIGTYGQNPEQFANAPTGIEMTSVIASEVRLEPPALHIITS